MKLQLPSLIFLATLSAGALVRRVTNAELLRRGLPPNAPRMLYDAYVPHLAKRSDLPLGCSKTPVINSGFEGGTDPTLPPPPWTMQGSGGNMRWNSIESGGSQRASTVGGSSYVFDQFMTNACVSNTEYNYIMRITAQRGPSDIPCTINLESNSVTLLSATPGSSTETFTSAPFEILSQYFSLYAIIVCQQSMPTADTIAILFDNLEIVPNVLS